MATPNFKELLKKPLDEVKRPPPLPEGTYHGIIKSYEFGESSQKRTPFVRFNFVAMYAGEDVDQAALEGVEIAKKALRTDFYVTEDALYRLKEFLVGLGHDVEGKGVEDILPLTTNAQVVMSIKQTRQEGKEDIYNTVEDVTAES